MANHDNYDHDILRALQGINKSLKSIAECLDRAAIAGCLYSEAKGAMDAKEVKENDKGSNYSTRYGRIDYNA